MNSREQLELVESFASRLRSAKVRFILVAHFPEGGGALFANKQDVPNEDGQTLVDDLAWAKRTLNEGTEAAINLP